jgi:hypothetical protein
MAMGLIEELNAKEESQISTKLNKEKEKKAALNAKEKQKRQKKQDKNQKVLLPSALPLPCVYVRETHRVLHRFSPS